MKKALVGIFLLSLFSPLSPKELTIREAILLVIEKSLSLRSSAYDVLMSDSPYRKYLGRYAWTIGIGGDYQKRKLPFTGRTAFSGNEETTWNTQVFLKKLFPTGTSITTGVRLNFYDANDPAFGDPRTGFFKPADPPLYTPTIFFRIEQDLLRNIVGFVERKEREILYKQGEIQKRMLIFQLSLLVVETLIDYWKVALSKEEIRITEEELKATIEVRNIIARNTRLGRADIHELRQYNSLVDVVRSKLERMRLEHERNLRSFLKKVSVSPTVAVRGVTELQDSLPSLSYEELLEEAFLNRADYLNALEEKRIRELEYLISKNQALPSLKVGAEISALAQEENPIDAFQQVRKFQYPTWKVFFEMSYPIGSSAIETDIRDSYLKLKQVKLKIASLREEIREEIREKMQSVYLLYNMLQSIRKAKREAFLAYQNALRRAYQGKLHAVLVKGALDNYLNMQREELHILLEYNIALLELEIAKNTLFKKYGISIEDLLVRLFPDEKAR